MEKLNLNFRDIKGRNILEETARFYGYGYYEEGSVKAHAAPYFCGGTLVGYHLRFPSKEFSWMGEVKTLELFGQHLWRNQGGKRIVVTEGELDCLSVAQAFNLKWPVVSVPNGAPSAEKYIRMNLEFLEAYDEVVLWFDNDEQGHKAAKECASILSPGKVKIATTARGLKDANDLLKEGHYEDIPKCIWEARSFRPDGILSGEDLVPDLLEYYEGSSQKTSYSFPYPKLHAMLQGFRKGELWMFTAGTGIGKSTLVAELAFHFLMQHNLKVGYMAFEENKRRTALRMMSLYLDYPLHQDVKGVTKERYLEAMNSTVLSKRFFLYDHFGSLEGDTVLNKIKYMVSGLGCDIIILDHLSIIISGLEGDNERKQIDVLMTNLRSLVEQTQVGMLVVSHLRRGDTKSTSHEEGGRVTLADLRGSQSIAQLSDAVIALERNPQDPEDKDKSLARVLKNRWTGDVGMADELIYSKATGRLKASDGLF